MTRYISCSEWERFDYYASLIQTLSVKYDGWSLRWAPEVIAALHVRQTSLRRDLLPNLREVKLKTLDDHPSYAFFFLSRLLGSISITARNVPSDTAWLKSFISYLPLSSPHLESITLKLEYLENNPLPLEIESASDWINISTFHCEYSVTLSTALQLVQLPKLGALSLVVPVADTDPAPSHPIAHTAPNVKRLGISSHTLLDHCVFPSLETIEIRPGSQNELRSSLESIQKRCDLELLHGVEIMCPEMKGDPTKIDDVKILLSFRQLDNVSIRIGGSIFGNETLEQMAIAWPKLRSFRLIQPLTVCSPTLPGLIPLIQHCPELRSLAIDLDACDSPLRLENPVKACSNAHVTMIHFGVSSVRHLPEVAAFLLDLFPNLTKIKTKYSTKYLFEWSHVEGCIKRRIARKAKISGSSVS